MAAYERVEERPRAHQLRPGWEGPCWGNSRGALYLYRKGDGTASVLIEERQPEAWRFFGKRLVEARSRLHVTGENGAQEFEDACVEAEALLDLLLTIPEGAVIKSECGEGLGT